MIKKQGICLKMLAQIRKYATFWNQHTKVRLPESLMALATILLVFVTAIYVIFAGWLVCQQKSQFCLANRAKITVNGFFPRGDIESGVIPFINSGNLPAEDITFAWRIIHVKDSKIVKAFPKKIKSGKIKHASLEPDRGYSFSYESSLDRKDQFVFLIICCKYKGPGIKGDMPKDFTFLWNVKRESQVWAIPGSLDSKHVSAIENTKNKLRRLL